MTMAWKPALPTAASVAGMLGKLTSIAVKKGSLNEVSAHAVLKRRPDANLA